MVTDDKTPDADGGSGEVPQGAPGTTPFAQDAQHPQATPPSTGDPAQQAYTQGQTYAQSAYTQGDQAQAGDPRSSYSPQQPPAYEQHSPQAQQPPAQQAQAQGSYTQGAYTQGAYTQGAYTQGTQGSNPGQGQQPGQASGYSQGVYGQPTPAGYPQSGGYGGGQVPPGGASPSDPRKKKRIILISSLAGALVLLLIIGAVVINVINTSSYGPQASVQNYLQALSQGKASEANKMASPGDNEAATALLSDEILGESPELIKNPKVTDVTTTGDSAYAQFTYSLDGITYDGQLSLSNTGKQGLFFDTWTIDEPLVSPLYVYLNQGTEASVNGVNVDFGEEYSLDAYPAVYEVAAPDNTFFEAEAQTVAVGTGSKASYEGLEITLTPTEALTEEAQKQVNAHLDDCAAMTEIDPEGCNLDISWYLDFLDVSSAKYTVVEYPTVVVDESGRYFETEGGEVEAVVSGTPYSEGDPTEVSYVTNDDWSGYSGDVLIEGDEVTLEFY
ncbi:hypothetical protein GCM10027416_10690 [Okibacterium endophyticum]